MTDGVKPERVLIPRCEQVTPKPKGQLGYHRSHGRWCRWSDGTPTTSLDACDTPLGRLDIVLCSWLQQTAGVVQPGSRQPLSVVPCRHLIMDGVADYDLYDGEALLQRA